MPNFLEEFNSYIDKQGRQVSPLLERGTDGIPAVIPTPTSDDLKGFNTSDPKQVAAMSKMLNQYGVGGYDDMLNGARSRLERFNIRPGDPRYKTELERLTTSESGRVLLDQSRRTTQRFQTLSAVDGNMDQEMIRVPEGDEPCDECVPLAGITKPLWQFIADEEAPGDRCLGGDACLCQLYPID